MSKNESVRDNRIKKGDFKGAVGRFSRRAGERFWELDFLRGICIVLMVFDHLMYNMMDVLPVVADFFGIEFGEAVSEFALEYWKSELRNYVRFIVVCTFFGLCGISCTLSASNFKRGILLALFAAGITGVTGALNGFYSGFIVRFGVLHMLSSAVLAYAAIELFAKLLLSPVKGAKAKGIAEAALGYLPALIGIVLLCVYLTRYGTFSCRAGYPDFYSTIAPSFNAAENARRSVFIDIKDYVYDSADYFPLLPWAAMVLIGGAVGRAVYHTPAKYALRPLDGCWNKGVCFLGRHTAIIFLSHMVVIPLLTIVYTAVYSLFI